MATTSPKVPLGDKPGSNWVERTGALQPHSTNWIYRAAEHLKGKGMADGHAIAVAVNAARRLCASGDLNFKGVQQANPKSRGEACAAVAKWDAARAKAKATNLSEYSVMRALDLAGPRLARGLDLTDPQREVIDLAFNPTQARGFHGRWVKIMEGLKKLKPGESKTLHGPSGTKVERLAGGVSLDERRKIAAEEYRAVRAEHMRRNKGHLSGQQLAAVKGIARKRALARIDALDAKRKGTGFKVTTQGHEQHASTPGKAATLTIDALTRASRPRRTARNMTADQKGPIDLARTKRKDPLLSVDAAVSRLRKRPELKNASDSELRRIAAARILRRQIRRKLGISDLKKLPKDQLDQLKRLGLVGSRKATVGQTSAYTIQRGKRKGQTIQVRYGKSGKWSEVRPKGQSIPGAKR